MCHISYRGKYVLGTKIPRAVENRKFSQHIYLSMMDSSGFVLCNFGALPNNYNMIIPFKEYV